jgi:hypothetical protein
MEKQKKIILTLCAASFLMIFSQTQSWSGSDKVNKPLKTGDIVPAMKMEDIYGKERNNNDFLERVIVYSFADRTNSKTLQAAIGPANKKKVLAYPNVKIAYFNFADVVLAPNLMKYIINPILRYVNESNTKEMKKQYAEEGIPWNESMTTFMLIPEWDGDNLKVFGLENAAQWSVYITYQSKIYAVLDSKTKDFAKDYLDTFKTIVETNKLKK